MQRNINLYDLDELALLVRNDLSKTYISESIQAYKSGAYRAAIVTTWIAVAYDIIAKIRELAEAGDDAAQKDVDDLDGFIKNNLIQKLQEFEFKILEKACDEYEFINPIEYQHLVRIKEDRNASAPASARIPACDQVDYSESNPK